MTNQKGKWTPERIFSELYERTYKKWADSSVDYMDLSHAFQHGFDNDINWQVYRSYLADDYEPKDLDYLAIAYADGFSFGGSSGDTDIANKLKAKSNEGLGKKNEDSEDLYHFAVVTYTFRNPYKQRDTFTESIYFKTPMTAEAIKDEAASSMYRNLETFADSPIDEPNVDIVELRLGKTTLKTYSTEDAPFKVDPKLYNKPDAIFRYVKILDVKPSNDEALYKEHWGDDDMVSWVKDREKNNWVGEPVFEKYPSGQIAIYLDNGIKRLKDDKFITVDIQDPIWDFGDLKLAPDETIIGMKYDTEADINYLLSHELKDKATLVDWVLATQLNGSYTSRAWLARIKLIPGSYMAESKSHIRTHETKQSEDLHLSDVPVDHGNGCHIFIVDEPNYQVTFRANDDHEYTFYVQAEDPQDAIDTAYREFSAHRLSVKGEGDREDIPQDVETVEVGINYAPKVNVSVDPYDGKHIRTVYISEYLLPAIVNGDTSGLEDSDLEELENLEKSYEADGINLSRVFPVCGPDGEYWDENMGEILCSTTVH